jgi:hypothetical protein
MFSSSSFFFVHIRSEIDKVQNGEREEDLLLFSWEKEDFFCTDISTNAYG